MVICNQTPKDQIHQQEQLIDWTPDEEGTTEWYEDVANQGQTPTKFGSQFRTNQIRLMGTNETSFYVQV